ncbi:hypothetical protein [Aerococcus sp. 1KP-2016]|uniref:5'-methylthioadenosine/S-adenosylhomocysteine nucleosidase family protein n=1 Tax=Aerococcus sp. 1KP-2016 TaxID=1981982 RepID=UPI002101D294|nr:hypothetical protein [Aerococcus sp. 1KP-2016]
MWESSWSCCTNACNLSNRSATTTNNKTLLSKHHFFHTGQCLTSDAFMYQVERINFVRNAFPEGVIVEMEATAIAQVSYTYNLPFLSIKSVSDTSSEQAPEEYLKDKDQVAINAADVLFKAIDLLQQN